MPSSGVDAVLFVLWPNGTLVGETGINAALCGTQGCPVPLVTVTTRPAKRGRSCSARGRNVAPLRARKLIEDGARRALGSAPSSRTTRVAHARSASSSSTRARPTRSATEQAWSASTRAGSSPPADTWWEAWQQFFF